jgi:type I restriction enzyme, S subunit
MSEWEVVTIEEVASFIKSGGTPSRKKPEYFGGDIPWLTTKEVDFNNISDTQEKITEDGLSNSSAKWVPEGATIIAMYGATAGKVCRSKIPLTTNQACCNIVVDPSLGNDEFLFYQLWSRNNELVNLATGAAQQNLSVGTIKEFPITLPPLQEQHAIAEVLSSLDDKIDLLKRQNKTLEGMAEALFKMHKEEAVVCKCGWVPLATIASICLGGTPSRKRKDFWGGKIPWINSGELNRPRITHASEFITRIGYESSSTKLMRKGSSVIAITGATMGKCAILEGEFCGNQSIVGVTSESEIDDYLLFLMIKDSMNELLMCATGAAQAHINKNDVIEHEVIDLRSYENLVFLNEQLSALSAKISSNSHTMSLLTRQRDTLLPKLMSGEVRVQMD